MHQYAPFLRRKYVYFCFGASNLKQKHNLELFLWFLIALVTLLLAILGVSINLPMLYLLFFTVFLRDVKRCQSMEWDLRWPHWKCHCQLSGQTGCDGLTWISSLPRLLCSWPHYAFGRQVSLSKPWWPVTKYRNVLLQFNYGKMKGQNAVDHHGSPFPPAKSHYFVPLSHYNDLEIVFFFKFSSLFWRKWASILNIFL